MGLGPQRTNGPPLYFISTHICSTKDCVYPAGQRVLVFGSVAAIAHLSFIALVLPFLLEMRERLVEIPGEKH